MRIRNAEVLIGRSFCRADVAFDQVITAVEPQAGAGGDCYVLPGLVDIHTHGAVGLDFSDGDREGLKTLAGWYAAQGITACLPTLMTLPEGEVAAAVEAMALWPGEGARCLGVHLEGPFLSPRRRGAQPAAYLRRPDLALLRRVDRGGLVRRITLACEVEGAMELLRQIAGRYVVSIGHSEADYDTAMAAFQGGAGLVTHLYNAMPPLHHREPGLIGAAADSGAYAELICDGFHVHPAAVRAAFRLFGERLVLVSDSLRCAGLGDGTYTLAGQQVTVAGGRAVLADGTLAGSAISLLEGVRRAVGFGIPLAHAAYAASTAPALAMGAGDTGAVAVGRRADLLVLDQSLEIVQVYVGGRPVPPVSG